MRLATGLAFAVLGTLALVSCDAGVSSTTETVQWTDGWEAGVAAAQKKGTPMLVYVGRKSPG